MARPKNLTENYRLRPRKDGIFEVAWTDLKTGKARRVSTGTKNQQTARMRFSQIVADSKKVMPPDTVTLEWVVAQYLAEKEATKTPRQYLSIKTSLAPILKRLGNLRPDQISQTTIDGYVRSRGQDIKWAGDGRERPNTTPAKISNSTIVREIRALRAALNNAHAQLWVPSKAAFIIKISENKPKDVWLTKEEVQRILTRCEEHDRAHLELYILLAVATAARKEAILSLTWEQIHIPARVKQAGVGKGVYIDFGEGTGNKRRPKIPVGENYRLWTLLTPPTSLMEGEERPHDKFVITYQGEPIADLKKGLATAAKEARIKKRVTPHVLKHTSITWMVQSGMHPARIAELVNTTEKMIRKVYSHHIPDYHLEIGNAVAL